MPVCLTRLVSYFNFPYAPFIICFVYSTKDFFQTTGTLTTDELVAVGVLEQSGLLKPKATDKGGYKLKPMIQVHNEAALVMAGCHSLVVFDGETTSDPLKWPHQEC